MSSAPIISFDEIDSTNAEARRRVEAGEVGPLWLTALRQTAGRGRRGRQWQTETGNLAATYLFTTTRSPAEAAQVAFVAALAVADLAEHFAPAGAPRLKWPNDLLLQGRKSAGILVESGTVASGELWLAVGIGVNLAHAPDPGPDAALPTTWLGAFMPGPPPSPGAALPILAAALDHWLTLWSTQGFPAIARAWTARAHGLGQSCIARLPNESIIGVAEGLDADGALRLRGVDGLVRRITAGDVFF